MAINPEMFQIIQLILSTRLKLENPEISRIGSALAQGISA